MKTSEVKILEISNEILLWKPVEAPVEICVEASVETPVEIKMNVSDMPAPGIAEVTKKLMREQGMRLPQALKLTQLVRTLMEHEQKMQNYTANEVAETRYLITKWCKENSA